jgi:hypothetical protein
MRFVLKQGREIVADVVPTIERVTVKSGATVTIAMTVELPDLPSGKADAYICVQQKGLCYGANNERGGIVRVE